MGENIPQLNVENVSALLRVVVADIEELITFVKSSKLNLQKLNKKAYL